jgi:hypothetical protein
MSLNELPLAVLRYQYQMARVPFQVIEDQFVARMNPEAPARLLYERSLGAVDATAGKMLGDPELEKRGAALARRGDALGRAAQLDVTATQKQRQADDQLKAKRDKAKQVPNQARATKQRQVKQARSVAQERKQDATAAAQKRTAAAQQLSDDLAPQRINADETAKRDGQTQMRAAEEDAITAAASDLADAQPKRSDAASTREQADQIEALADAEKQNRKSERVNGS